MAIYGFATCKCKPGKLKCNAWSKNGQKLCCSVLTGGRKFMNILTHSSFIITTKKGLKRQQYPNVC
jgi:hypothetical protein